MEVLEVAVDIKSEGLMPILDVGTFQLQLKKFQEIVQSYLVPGIDFGKIPGTDKDTLLKPGAEKMCEIYGFYADYQLLREVELWDKEPSLFDYTIKCTIKRRNDDKIMGESIASCNSYEAKYKWREAKRKCPSCKKEAIIKGKEEYGGGWICFRKQGGCGLKFVGDAAEIIGQVSGKVLNDDIATQKNTILKMAEKRALVGAAIAATRSSGIFTQDVEDFVDSEIKVQEKPQVAVSANPKESSEASVNLEETKTYKILAHPTALTQKKNINLISLFEDAMANGKTEEEIDVFLKQEYGVTQENFHMTPQQLEQAYKVLVGIKK